ncbi:Equilibrative Nucleoside Transporter [Blattamonas nauphoetae]|uniref:Equilibrative Nucleoside Transporter n=1 Tax=Blattamonas nauphoetae TaxID=2049346 RepID=A0ABQ9XI56_9EUKA|nr:Equilibrative Nucleoside Transporter [Blattamonas nauphoetae]
MCIVMICIPFVCTLLANTFPALVLMLIFSFLCGIASALTSCSVFGLSGIFSGHAPSGIMVGQGIAGLISLLPLILHISLPGDNTDLIGYIFFSFAAIINVLALISLICFRILPYPKHILKTHSLTRNPTTSVNLSQVELLHDTDEPSILVDEEMSDTLETDSEPTIVHDSPNLMEANQILREIGSVAKKLRWWAFSVFFVYALTLTFYPSVILAVPAPKHMFDTEWSSSLWTHIRINIFCVADFVARWCGSCVKRSPSSKTVVALTLARIILAVALLLALWVKWMRNIVFFSIIYFLFSFSNGLLGTIIMSHANEQCRLLPHELGLGGSFMSMIMNVGLSIGCVLAIPLGLITPLQ